MKGWKFLDKLGHY